MACTLRLPRILGSAALLVLLALAGCTSTAVSAGGGTLAPSATATSTATATPAPSCAAALPGAAPIDLASHGFVYPMTYPANTVAGSIATTASGTGLFTVYQFSACTQGTSLTGVTSFYVAQLPALPHGWIGAQTFPDDGGLMTACGGACFWDPKGGPIYYLAFDQFTDRGGGVVTYRGRWAVFDDAALPSCNANFSSSAAQRGVFFIGGGTSGFPLPPFSDTAPDDAAGGVKGLDVCSPGTAASVAQFLSKEVPAAGWTKVTTSDPHCTNPANCWTKGGQFWSWVPSIGDPADWVISYRQPFP